MLETTLIVPGLNDSGPGHWQSWLEGQLPDVRRVRHIDWNAPVLARWATEVRREIDEAVGVVWLVAHSYGCLASVVAAADRPERVAGLLLVAPPDPDRFSAFGLREARHGADREGLASWIPSAPIGVPSVVVASRNDPWAPFEVTTRWADAWGSLLVDVGHAGHINLDSGHGSWPQGLALLAALKDSYTGLPLGSIDDARLTHKGKRGALARLRHRTRFNWEVFTELSP
ncbi:MAG: alpha/beta hydrolase [Zoogloea sp.]|nr:alpha/beta hydrolase [Zoogloea sp.]